MPTDGSENRARVVDGDSPETHSTRLTIALVAIILLIRAIVLIAGIFAARIHPEIGGGVEGVRDGVPWIAWDSWHYLRILEFGYPPIENGIIPHRVAFLPLYPLVARLLTPIFSPEVALIVLANLCSIVGFIFMYRWLRQITSQRIAAIGVLLMCAYPGAVFFSAALTEAPFFMMCAIALYLLKKKKLMGAAIVSALASALRPTAVALAVVVVIHYWHGRLSDHAGESRRATRVNALLMSALLGVISIAGLIVHEAYLVHRYHRIDAISVAQGQILDMMADTYRASAAAGETRYSIAFFLNRAMKPTGWNRAFWLPITLVVFIGIFRPRKIPRTFFLLPLIIWIMCTIPERGLRISSAFRYESAAIPIFALLAIWLHDLRRHRAAIGAMALYGFIVAQVAIQVYYAVLFSRGVWVG